MRAGSSRQGAYGSVLRFLKISALGVGEQRVNIVMDFVDPPGRLGDRYRADVRIILGEADDVPTVLASALFRRGQSWSAS